MVKVETLNAAQKDHYEPAFQDEIDRERKQVVCRTAGTPRKLVQ
jgi:hypothetical protein